MRRAPWIAFVALGVAACSSEFGADITGSPNFDAQTGTTITVEKTATGFLTKTFPWTIAKTASVETLDLFRGDSGGVRFTVELARGDSVYVTSVAGQVCVTNGGAAATEGLKIVDKVMFHTGSGTFQDLSGATVTLEPEEQVPAGEQRCYDYAIPFEPQTDGVYMNVAFVTITNLEGLEGSPAGPDSVTADFTAPTTETGEANRSVTVEDTWGQSWTFEDSGSQTYDALFTCDDHAGENDNVATIVETGDVAEARVTVSCYALDVTKTAETEYTRTFAWEVTKMSDTTNLTLPRGFPWDVSYSVVVDTSGYADGDASVSGMITIANPAPMAVSLTGVADVVSDDIAMTVDCQVEFPVALEASGSLECSYEGALPDVAERTNTATVTIQNVNTDADGNVTETGTTGFAGSTTVAFGDPAYEMDTCVDVTDDWYGDLGTVCMSEELPHTFDYVSTLGAYEECGTFTETNTVSFLTADNAVSGDATWDVEVLVPCGPDCVLGQGYWKTHSEFGPAPYDETWAYLPFGADTPFYGTGMSWVTMMREPPKGGNAYIKLARQYMAAWLNGLHGADLSEVADDIAMAMELLDHYDGDPEAFDVDDKDLKHQFEQLQSRLDEFNSGMMGTTSCDDVDDDS